MSVVNRRRPRRAPASLLSCAFETLESRRLLASAALSIAPGLSNVSETNPTTTGRGTFNVTRTGPTTSALAVQYYVRNTSTATGGQDFNTLSGTVTIPKGRSSAVIHVTPIDDSATESPETIVLVLTPGAIALGQRTATLTIQDNDVNSPPPPSVSLDITTGLSAVSETNPTTTGRGTFNVSRSGPTGSALNVSYYVRSTSTATSGQDFAALSGTMTIPKGKSTGVIHFTPIDDNNDEPAEDVILVLSAGDGISFKRRTATLTIQDNDEPPSISGWWNDGWTYRTAISVAAGSHERNDQPVDRSINFSSILSSVGGSGSLILDSLRVIETSSDGQTVLDDNVPFQFDAAGNYNASSNAAGNLIILTEGTTAANATRHYHVYFDTTGNFTAQSFTPLVTTTDNIMDEGYSSIRIATQLATYYYQKEEGGFSSLVDANGNDWISWNSGSGSGGEFRGIPNLGPAGFHPGRDHDIDTSIISQGVLKTTLESTDGQGNKVRWEFYPNFARLTVVDMNQAYYVLYEGTPGGSFDTDGSDTVVRSDNTTTGINDSWADTNGLGSENGEEWVYFRDSDVNRYLYMVHNTPDGLEDGYFGMENNLTVFGFGRRNNSGSDPGQQLTADNNVFTLGLADGGGNFDEASDLINGVYRNISVNLGTSQSLD